MTLSAESPPKVRTMLLPMPAQGSVCDYQEFVVVVAVFAATMGRAGHGQVAIAAR